MKRVAPLVCLTVGLFFADPGFLHAGDQERKKRPNIVIIWVDALRADHLSCYGYGRKTSPFIDTLADQGALFENCISASSWTKTSGISFFTSQWVSIHGIETPVQRFGEESITFTEILQKNGYATAAFVQSPFFHPELGFKQGFDYYSYPIMEYDSLSEFRKIIHFPAKAIFPWVEAHVGEPFFIWVHLFYPHGTYTPPEPYNRRFVDDHYAVSGRQVPVGEDQLYAYKVIPGYQNLDGRTDIDYYVSQYDGEILFTDSKVKKIVDKLSDLGILDDTLIMISADHGENLGENEYYFVHTLLYDPVIRVPLIIRYPPAIPGGSRIPYQVRSVDLAPTIFDILGIPLPDAMVGKSLMPFIRQEEKTDRTALSRGHSLKGGFAVDTDTEGARVTSIRVRIKHHMWKLIYHLDRVEASADELYDLTQDPQESTNVIKKSRGTFRFLEKLLLSMIRKEKAAASPKEEKFSPETKALLRSLGYAQ